MNNMQPHDSIISHMGGRDRDRLHTQVVKSQAATRPVLFLRSQPMPSSSKGFLEKRKPEKKLRDAMADLPLFVLHGSASEIYIPYF